MSLLLKRKFHSSTVHHATKNLKKFSLPNYRNVYEPKKIPKHLFEDFYNYPISRDPLGIRWPGYWFKRKFVYVKEMEPELVVPNLDNFNLKPYVSYKTPTINNSAFTAEDLFKVSYGNSIIEAYMNGENVQLTHSPEQSEAARIKHLQTGADMFGTTAKEMEAEQES
ncbi:39S ribosomal protein L41, mitochondrial-like [Panonychus citri]|uniref:39S ribosomal protein L41, mitochondrial-like n=1 Tax=Panonychus citri TaxID=50023 RepID=UPI002306FCD5|nr:39S ribosomal protein L41, mitochondrial-like [Panonychus citri]